MDNFKRFVGLYHYSAYWQSWDFILGYDPKLMHWHVIKVDMDGNPKGKARFHGSYMNLKHFADKPFRVHYTDL